MNENGYIAYQDLSGTTRSHKLWIMDLEQDFGLSGSNSQGRWNRQFYPKSQNVGTLTVSGRCKDQVDYQALAKFVRGHHKIVLNTTTGFIGYMPSPGLSNLMTLSVPAEGIWIQGVIANFHIQKRGVFQPAPEYSFPFTLLYDPHSQDANVSFAIRQWFTRQYDDLKVPQKLPSATQTDPSKKADGNTNGDFGNGNDFGGSSGGGGKAGNF